MMPTQPISGYVLAGGRSSRMGTDKSLLLLAGKPLIQQAVTKLGRVCAEVHILSANPALAAYAPLVPDIHPGCGPIGGIEAALAHSPHDWILILPVDVPFLPTALLQSWIATITAPDQTTRVAMFSVDGRTQPAVCLLHKQNVPSIAAAVALGEFKLLPVLEASAEVLALQLDQPLDQLLRIDPIGVHLDFVSGITPRQLASQPLWFANLNTPEDFAEAEAHLDALDT
jgi:molybdopterin-guanine dinucleotide biosynthesis protein A